MQCSDKQNLEPKNQFDYFAFGVIGGFCVPDVCNPVYKIQDQKLSQDISRCLMYNWLTCPSEFVTLSEDEYKLVRELPILFPEQLFEIEDNKCQSCPHDGQEIFLEISQNGEKRTWIISSINGNSEVNDYLKMIREKISALQD